MSRRIAVSVSGNALLEARIEGVPRTNAAAPGAVVTVLRSGVGSPQSCLTRACLAAARLYGLASVEIDLRGTGASTGMLIDDHLALERLDFASAIGRLAGEPWWPGQFALVGIGEAANAALLVASDPPEGLSAVAVAGASLDRRRDAGFDAEGRIMPTFVDRAAAALGWLSAPPATGTGTAGWRLVWLERMRTIPFQAEAWIRHPAEDGYWRASSVAERLGKIRAPVLAAGSEDGPDGDEARTIASAVGGLSQVVTGQFGASDAFRPTSGVAPGFPALAARWAADRLLGDAEAGDESVRISSPDWVLVPADPEPGPGGFAAGWKATFERDGARYDVEQETRLDPGPSAGMLLLEARLMVRQDGRPAFERRWSTRVAGRLADQDSRSTLEATKGSSSARPRNRAM